LSRANAVSLPSEAPISADSPNSPSLQTILATVSLPSRSAVLTLTRPRMTR